MPERRLWGLREIKLFCSCPPFCLCPCLLLNNYFLKIQSLAAINQEIHPWLMCIKGLGIILQPKRSLAQFLVRSHVLGAG